MRPYLASDVLTHSFLFLSGAFYKIILHKTIKYTKIGQILGIFLDLK